MKIKIENACYVIGRGHIIVCTLPENVNVHVGDKITANNTEYEIRGIECLSFIKHVGLILNKEINKDIEYFEI